VSAQNIKPTPGIKGKKQSLHSKRRIKALI
jgi:hypothetical protein